MGKKMRSTTKKKRSRSRSKVINEDGILCLIISSLTLREAVRTSILSRRWRHIWTYLPQLNFDRNTLFDDTTLDSFKSLTTGSEKCSFLTERTNQFIRSVDSVLHLHQGHSLDTFSIRYFLYKAHSENLDAWVRFAVASKTKTLELYLEQHFSGFNVELYDFPFHLLGGSTIEVLRLACCSFKQPSNYNGLYHLKRLVLWCTDATDSDINLLLSSCNTLERLCLLQSKQFVELTIPNSLTKLCRLVIKDCYRLTRIDIDALNLSYMCYDGLPVDFVFKQSLHLKEAKIYFKTKGSSHSFNFYLNKLATTLPHLQSLTLNISGVSSLCSVEDLPKGSRGFIHLKCLKWECPERTIGVKMSLPHLATLLDVAPFLEEFELHLSTCGVEPPPPRLRKMTNKLPKHPHFHLKTIKISGFYFEKWQVQIVLYLLNNAPKLELMTLEKGRLREISETDLQKLYEEVPTNAKLVIL